MAERDYAEEQQRACDIEQEIDDEIDKEWSGEVPTAENDWNQQTEVTNKALIRVVVLLEHIHEELQVHGELQAQREE
jgi:hypothetical protein